MARRLAVSELLPSAGVLLVLCALRCRATSESSHVDGAAQCEAPALHHDLTRPHLAVVFLTYKNLDSLQRVWRSYERALAVGVDDTRSAPLRFSTLVSVDTAGGVVDELRALVADRPWIDELLLYDRAADLPLCDTRAPTRRSDNVADSRLFIARHFASVLVRVFAAASAFSHAVLVEDDLLLAPDFLRYLSATLPLLDADPTLVCVSAWNDNGGQELAESPARLLRTQSFPNLAWMIRRQLWTDELALKWPRRPSSGWDHWMRLGAQMRGRECIFPEVSRVFHTFERGASNVNRLESRRSFDSVRLNDDVGVDYGDLRYLRPERYERWIESLLARAVAVPRLNFVLDGTVVALHERHTASSAAGAREDPVYLLTYTREAFTSSFPRRLGVFSTPRGVHRGLIVLRREGRWLLLADRRRCEYLPDAQRLFADPRAVHVAAEFDQSCAQACAGAGGGRRCRAAEQEFVNSCELLRQHFPCEAGCGFEWGKDLPGYVSVAAAELDARGQCLENGAAPIGCDGHSPHVRRLCACV